MLGVYHFVKGYSVLLIMIKIVIFNKLLRRSINLSGVYGTIWQRNRGVNHGKIKHTRGDEQ